MHIAENYWFNWFFGLWTFRHRFDVGTLLLVFELNMKNPAFAKQKNSSNAKGFLWRTNPWQAMHVWDSAFQWSEQFVSTIYRTERKWCSKWVLKFKCNKDITRCEQLHCHGTVLLFRSLKLRKYFWVSWVKNNI